MNGSKTFEELVRENEELTMRLEEATETINAIRNGQVDALVVNDAGSGLQLYTLKTADQTYRVFIEKMNEGAVTLNEDGIVLYANSKFASMVDLPLSKVVGHPFELFIAENVKEHYKQLFSIGWKEDTKMELTIKRADGTVPCQLSVTTLLLDEGQALSVIVTDMTFQKNVQYLLKENNRQLARINAELEASNYDLQQFASVASHDLQEPLRKILIFSTMLKNKHREELPTESREHLDKIISASLRMRTMISDILNYSRLSTDDDHFDTVSLREVVEEVLDDYEILLKEKNVQVVLGEMPKIEGNRAQIKQVFQNLISNSIKFGKVGLPPIIEIDCKPTPDMPGAMCVITVDDNGIGFDAAYQERIFSLFERLNAKDKYEGSGIGLAITKKILDKHNGSISAESREGQGARFTIRLPLHRGRPVE
ncbi:sensor histidine kinase [Dyadobacter luticola]|uniref:histidine kinase n=1 Tax=Dyadobacter luticola TaxID=1979387 RepID=A0A5R9L199_9BACT|nr:ATP-binding protein [Dyadobacter luticola]TLV02188.1 PAS domain-containing protein [Dyadobacter luticola]